MENKEIKILIVEDDYISAEYLKEILENAGYIIVDMVDTGYAAIQEAKSLKPDIVLMDIMLKDKISGCEAALQIKQNHNLCKIIFITAYADDEMIEYATDAEAYGYLMKPYREQEILATIKVALSHDKHQKPQHDESFIVLEKGFVYDKKEKKLYKDDKEILLATKKLKLLQILIEHKNNKVSNEDICHYVWGEPKNDSTLRSLIHRMKTAIGEDIITNLNGQGYMIS
jgi:DNA-binding response OmpR family regulator